jgi:hypothetical protein
MQEPILRRRIEKNVRSPCRSEAPRWFPPLRDLPPRRSAPRKFGATAAGQVDAVAGDIAVDGVGVGIAVERHRVAGGSSFDAALAACGYLRLIC